MSYFNTAFYIYIIILFSHCLLSNILSVILRPRFEPTINTAREVVENNITIIKGPGTYYWIDFLMASPIEDYKTIAKNLKVAADYQEWEDWNKDLVIGKGYG